MIGSGLITRSRSRIPACTFDGAINGGDQTWTAVGDMTFTAGSILKSGSTNGNTLLLAANDTTFITLTTGTTDTLDIGTHTISGILTIGNTLAINTGIVDNDYFTIGAVDNDTNTITELMRFVGSATPNVKFTEGIPVYIGDSAVNTSMSSGITIEEGNHNDQVLAFGCNDQVAHGYTTYALTSVWGFIKRNSSGLGGLRLDSIGENNAGQVNNLIFNSRGGQADTTKSTAGRGLIELYAEQHNGTNVVANVAANGNIFAVKGYTGGGVATQLIVDIDGDVWTSGGALQNFAVINNIAYAAMVEILGDCSIFLPFSEATGSTITDYTANGHDATASKDISTWDTPPAYQGSVYVYDFDGTDEEMDVADSADFSTATAFSVGAWVNMTDSTNSTIISVWDALTATPKREFKLYLDANDYPSFEIYDETNDATIGREDQTALSQGTWHYIVGVFTGGTDAANAEVYVDGLALSDADIADDAGFADVVDSGAALDIGFEEDTSSAPTNFFDGKMWNPFYTKKELSADEVWNLYKIGKGLLNV